MKFFFMLLTLLSTSAWAEITTIEGEIVKIVPAQKEIYVEEDGVKHEFYFTEKTSFLNNAKFEDLKQGMTVKVVADKKGKRYDPQSVEIIK